MIAATICNFLLILFCIDISKISGELNYDLHHYDVNQQSNIPISMPNIKMKPGFRLKTGISDHQRAKLSWLAANTESNRQPPLARSFRLTTKQPKVPSISGTNYHYTDYYDKLPYNPTSSPIYYSSNFQTIPSTYYSAQNYLSPTFIQPTHLPVSTMITAIQNILSILQKTVYPNDSDDTDFNTIRNIPKETNLINSNEQLSQSTSLLLSSSLSPLLASSSSSSSSSTTSSSASASSSLSSSSSSAALAAAAVREEGRREKVGEIGVTMTSRNDNGDIEKDQLVNVEQMKGKGIRKVEGVAKLIDSKFHEMNKTRNTATTVTTISTTTTAAVDDGSNLLGSLLSGRLDKVDWFGSLFGTQLPSKEEGSAMAQIFEGGIFGPAS